MPPRKYIGRVMKPLDCLVDLEKARGGSELSEAMCGGVVEAVAKTELGKAVCVWYASWGDMQKARKALHEAKCASAKAGLPIGMVSISGRNVRVDIETMKVGEAGVLPLLPPLLLQNLRESYKKVVDAGEDYKRAREAYMKARGTLEALAKAEVAMEKARGEG